MREFWNPFENTFQEIEEKFEENASMVRYEGLAQHIVESQVYREQQKRRQEDEDKRRKGNHTFYSYFKKPESD